MASLILVRNVVGELRPKRTLAASRGFLAAARLSCFSLLSSECGLANTLLLMRNPPPARSNIGVSAVFYERGRSTVVFVRIVIVRSIISIRKTANNAGRRTVTNAWHVTWVMTMRMPLDWYFVPPRPCILLIITWPWCSYVVLIIAAWPTVSRHVIFSLLNNNTVSDYHPPADHNYNLRDRPHNKQLPDRVSHLTNCNFIVTLSPYSSPLVHYVFDNNPPFLCGRLICN